MTSGAPDSVLAAPPPPPPPPRRRHDLDALRAFAMLLGIGLHAAIPFVPWRDSESWSGETLDLFTGFVHGFRMPLFFLISGFFTAMLWRRRGMVALLKHRFRRIFLPLFVGYVPITVAVIIGMIVGWAIAFSDSEDQKAVGRYNQQVAGGEKEEPEGHFETKPWTEAREEGDVRGDGGGVDLRDAIFRGDLALVRRMVDNGSDVNGRHPEDGSLPLCTAAFRGHREIAEFLIERGADVSGKQQDGNTPLHLAAFLCRHELLDLLLEDGAALNTRNNKGETPVDIVSWPWSDLHEAVYNGLEDATGTTLDIDRLKRDRPRVRERLSAAGGESGKEEEPLGFAHMWFLWYLLWLIAGFWLVCSLRGLLSWLDTRLWLVLLPVGTLIAQSAMSEEGVGPDTSDKFVPDGTILAYYAMFFAFGALLWGRDRLESRLTARWPVHLGVAVILLFPLCLSLMGWGGGFVRWASAASQVAFAWTMSLGLMGLFSRYLSGQRRRVRFLSDSSYYMYLAHLPLVFVVQGVACKTDWPVLVNFAFVNVVVFMFLLFTYRYLVRYTPIGWLLNGRIRKATDPLRAG